METIPVHPSPAKISPPILPPSRRIDPFAALYREHRAFVRRVLLARGIAGADVEDLVQEVFTVVFRRGIFPPDDGQTRAWLWAIALRIGWNHRNLARHKVERFVQVIPVLGEEPRTVERIDAVRWLKRAVERLSPKLKAVLVGFVIEGRAMVDVARQLGIEVKTAWSRMKLARDEMARWGAVPG